MTDTFSEGDLIEAIKVEVASSTRFRGIVRCSIVRGPFLDAVGYSPELPWLEEKGFHLRMIEKARPALPTEVFTTIRAVYLPAGNANTKTTHLTLLPCSEGSLKSRWMYSNGISVDPSDLPRIQSFEVVARQVSL
jgi:hypothetical protein